MQSNSIVISFCPRKIMKTSTEINATIMRIANSRMYSINTKLIYNAHSYFLDKYDMHYGDGYNPSSK